jgi:hypothetical protein
MQEEAAAEANNSACRSLLWPRIGSWTKLKPFLCLRYNNNNHRSAAQALMQELCTHRPTVTVVQTVMDALVSIHHGNGNNVDPTTIVDAKGRTPLHIAATFGCSLDVVALLMAGNSTAALTKDLAGRYPLHWACAHSVSSYALSKKAQKKAADSMVQVINALIEAYVVAAVVKDQAGHTPLDLAVAAHADPRTIAALQLVAKILAANNNNNGANKNTNKTSSTSTKSTYEIMPVKVAVFDGDNDDDVSSVGSRGVSRHVGRHMSTTTTTPKGSNRLFL